MLELGILHNKAIRLDIAILLFGFADTFSVYLLSNYYATVIGSDNVSFFFMLAASISLLFFFCIQPIIRAFGKARTLYFFLLSGIILLAILSRLNVSYFSAAILLLFNIISVALWVLFDVLLEGFTPNHVSGRTRGLSLTLSNLGVLLAPLLAALVLTAAGYQGVFFVCLLFYCVIFMYTLVGFRKETMKQPLPRLSYIHGLREVLRRKELRHSYALSFGLYFFYAVMIIYMPLYLLNLGFGWQEIGLLFTSMLIPFVLIQYPLGWLADRKYGEKEMLLVSLIIGIAATIGMGILTTTSFLSWAILLVISRFGIAGLEVLKESYFYKHVDGDDVDVIAFFYTSQGAASIFATALASGLLVFLPLESSFFLTAGVLALVFCYTLRMVDTR